MTAIIMVAPAVAAFKFVERLPGLLVDGIATEHSHFFDGVGMGTVGNGRVRVIYSVFSVTCK